MIKKFFIFLLLILLCLVGAATWLYLHKEGEAQSAIKKQLTELGFDVKELEVSECGLRACKISKLRIGEDDFLIENAAVQYNASSLIAKRISAIDIDSISIRIALKPDAMRIAGYSIKPNADTISNPIVIPALPLDALTIKTLNLTIDDSKAQTRIVIEGIKLASVDAKSQRISIDSILHNAKLPLIIPLALKMETRTENNTLQFSGVIKDNHSKGLQANFNGLWNGNDRSYTLDGDIKPLLFETAVLQPQDIVPVAAGVANQVKGSIAAKILLSFDGKTIEQSATLQLKQVSANMYGMQISGANSVLQFGSLNPLLTAGKQTINIDTLEAGVPLVKGKIQFEIAKGNIITLYPMKWDWSGGSLVTDKMTINTNAPFSEQIRLHVRQIDLNALLALVLDKGVEAVGRLDGTIPIRISKGHVLIDQASLMATAPGKVIYKPADTSVAASGGEQTELLMKALENFQFSLLSMSVNSKEDGNTLIGLKISGGNPDLYGGKAIELNVNLQGRLEEIIKSNMDAYALPSQLEKQLQEKLP